MVLHLELFDIKITVCKRSFPLSTLNAFPLPMQQKEQHLNLSLVTLGLSPSLGQGCQPMQDGCLA